MSVIGDQIRSEKQRQQILREKEEKNEADMRKLTDQAEGKGI